MEEILEEINTFVEWGGQEVVFTGINLGAWGSISSNDYKDSRLIELIEAVLERTTLERLRISSLGVEFLSDRLIALFAQPRINAYVHLSIQSGSTRILWAMNRHYDAINVREVLQKLRNMKREDHTLLNIGADLIVGFPSETAEDFADTEQLVREYEITQLHAFPFSGHLDHYSVPAGSYPDQIPNHIAQSRLKHLLETGRQVFETFTRKNIGKKVRVLIEKVGKNAISSGSLIQDYPIAINQPTTFSWWSKNYLFCNETNIELFPDQEIARGKIVEWLYLHPIHAKIDGE